MGGTGIDQIGVSPNFLVSFSWDEILFRSVVTPSLLLKSEIQTLCSTNYFSFPFKSISGTLG